MDTDGANIVGHFTPCPPISTPNICCYRCYISQYSSSSCLLSLATLVIFVSVHCTFPRIYYHPKVKVYLRHARHGTSKTSEQSFHCQCQRPEIWYHPRGPPEVWIRIGPKSLNIPADQHPKNLLLSTPHFNDYNWFGFCQLLMGLDIM